MTAPARASAGGSIYDLGYRNYDGPRLGRRHAIRALFLQTLRACYGIGRGGRAKLAPIILGVLATLPAVVAVGVVALARQAGAPPGMVEEASPISHETYYSVITTLVVLFCAAQVPETVGRDQRYGLLSLYFSRALRRSDYALARFAGVTAAIFIFVIIPQAVIFFGLVLSAEDIGTEFGNELAFLPGIVGQAVILSTLLGAISTVVSGFTPRRVYATTAIIVLLAVTPIVSAVLIELGTRALAALLVLLSPGDILDATNAWLFDTSPDSQPVILSRLPLEAFAVAAAVIVVGCVAVLVRRFERIAA